MPDPHLDRLVALPDVWGFVSRRWPTAEPFAQACKVAEEAGEVVGAVIKQREGRRSESDVLDELADTILAATAAIQARGADAESVVAQRWNEVKTR